MARVREPEKVPCCVCQKPINTTRGKHIYKNIDGSGKISISEVRLLRNGNWVCSNVCLNLATQQLRKDPIEAITTEPNEPTGK